MRMTMLAGLLALAACQDATVQGGGTAAAQSAPPQLTPVELPQSDGAGNRLEALSRLGDGAVYCVGAEDWCVAATSETSVSVAQNAGAQIALPARGVMWPNIIVSQGSAIVGVIETETQSYSGGGGSAEHLVLFKVADGSATEIARLPYSGSIMIRACFSEEDTAARADACHDQYEFVSRVRLDDTVTSGAPQIVLETAAATYPGRVTRQADSQERQALTQADLVWATDEMCSFRRTYHATASGPYLPDTELPACTDYLEP
jgi:hypothetical protein